MGRPFSSPLSRRSDPRTSAEAAERVSDDGTVDTHEWRILTVLREMPRGGTGSEIAAAITRRYRVQMTNVQVMRRMRALLDRGQVHRRLDPRTGRYIRRGGETVHYYGSGECPLFER